MNRLLKAIFIATYTLLVVASMKLVSVFPEPWNIIAQIVVLIIGFFLIIDDESKKKKEDEE